MRVLVAGSRNFDRPDVVAGCLSILASEAVKAGDTELVVVHGCADGADAHADEWVRTGEHPWELNVTAERHPANWSKYGKAAGFKRNAEMVHAGADVALVFWRDESRGAGHTIRLAEEAEIPTQIVRYEDLPALEPSSGR